MAYKRAVTREDIEDTAKETVEELFNELLDDPSPEGLTRAREDHPDATEAILTYLRARHVAGAAPTESWETIEVLLPVLQPFLAGGGSAAASGLLTVALDARVAELRALADLVMGVVPPDELARALIAALATGASARWRTNARELAYRTFDAAAGEYQASRELRARLAAALAGATIP